MIKTSVARRYAKALFELLDSTAIESARAGLAGLGQAFHESTELRHVLASPAFRPEDKIDILSDLGQKLAVPPVVHGFLSQLVRKNRVGFLPEIAQAFSALADQAKGARQVTVTSACPLSAEDQQALRDRLRSLMRRDVELSIGIDPTLLSGLRIQIGSTVIDSTVRSRLTALRTALTKE